MMNQTAVLFRPQTAIRVRWNTNSDTPIPPDEAAGDNPPDGAMIDYYLGPGGSRPVTIEIKDEAGQVVRRYSSADPLPTPDPTLAIPQYWVRPPQKLSGDSGMHRFLWDLHYQPVPRVQPQYPIAAVFRNTAPSPTSPWAMPGKYKVSLMVGGKHYDQDLLLTMDPRVKTSTADLAEQFRLSKQLYDEWMSLNSISETARSIRAGLGQVKAEADLKTHVDALSAKLQAFAGAGGGGPGGGGFGGPGGGGGGGRATVGATTARIRGLFGQIEEADLAPTPQAAEAVPDAIKESRALQQSWQDILSTDIAQLKRELQAAGLPAIEVPK
jgi:hypothetical protein